MLMSCVHPVAILNAELCITCSLLMLVEDTRGHHIEEAYYRAGLMTGLYVAMSVCCCLPTPMTLASGGGSPMFPLGVQQPASPSI